MPRGKRPPYRCEKILNTRYLLFKEDFHKKIGKVLGQEIIHDSELSNRICYKCKRDVERFEKAAEELDQFRGSLSRNSAGKLQAKLGSDLHLVEASVQSQEQVEISATCQSQLAEWRTRLSVRKQNSGSLQTVACSAPQSPENVVKDTLSLFDQIATRRCCCRC